MEATTLWPGPRRQNYSPTLNAVTSYTQNGSGIVTTDTNNELNQIGSPAYHLGSPTSVNPINSHGPKLANLRPCLAGTQSLHHRANQCDQLLEKPGLTTDSSFTEVTQDSSGFGSLLVDDSTESKPRSPECQNRDNVTRWKESNLESLENDSSVLCEDHSEISDNIQLVKNALVTSPNGTNSSQGKNLPLSTQQNSNPHAKNETRDWSEHNEANSAFHLVSGRESRMLEENLASVARYVEELTGSATVAPGKTGQISTERFQTSQQPMQTPSSIVNHSPQQYISSKSQLQQLNEQLAALKAEKLNERGLQGIGNQEHLLRLLANQYPDLVMPTSNFYENRSHELSNWTTPNTSPQAGRMPLDTTPRRTGSHSYQLDSIGSPSSGGYSANTSIMSNPSDQQGTPESRRGSMIGSNSYDRRFQLNGRSGQLDFKAHGGLNTHPSISPKAVTDGYSNSNLENAHQQGTLAVLANLLGQLENNNGASQLHNESYQRNSALNYLLASLQERKSVMSSTPARDNLRPLTRPFNGAHENEPGPSTIQQSPNCSLSEELLKLAAPYQRLLGALENDIDHAANIYRNSASTVAQKSEAAYHWSGRLPVRVYRSMTFSRKVFLGGVPWDSTSDDLIMAFSRFGHVTVSWPQQETYNMSTMRSRTAAPKGYCYLIFEHESSVNELLAACVRDPTTGGDYYKISSSKFKAKDVQVIPWVISDSQYTKSGPYRPDSKRTVFIGALHGMITAEALVTIMNDLFGNVVFAALDTDKYKYPIGSGRVTFSSHKSYMRAVTANFVDVRTSKFVKTIQIDPYLEDSLCNSCSSSPGIYFCRAFECFRYFCPACWQLWHNSTESLYTHKPLRRTFKPVTDRNWSMVSKF